MIELVLMRVLPYCLLGALLAVGYFSALGWNVRLYAGHGTSWSALLVHAVRVFVVGGSFTLCANQGAVPVLSSFAGFQIVRAAAVNQQRRAFERIS